MWISRRSLWNRVVAAALLVLGADLLVKEVPAG
jgi:hypothetical protein